jgi:hypothetical protein
MIELHNHVANLLSEGGITLVQSRADSRCAVVGAIPLCAVVGAFRKDLAIMPAVVRLGSGSQLQSVLEGCDLETRRADSICLPLFPRLS